MTREETARLLQVLLVAYPGSKISADSLTLSLWTQMLADLPAEWVMAAARRMIAVNKYAPNIADIRGAVADAASESSGELTAGEAWARVVKALGRYGFYRPREAQEALGESVWRAVEMLGGWSYLCTTDDGLAVLSAQFERRYQAAAQQKRLDMQIPLGVRKELRRLTTGWDAGRALPGEVDEYV